MPFRLLLVHSDAAYRSSLELALTATGNLVTSVAGFREAKDHLLLALPDLLITAVKLGSYNGIQLVLRAHAASPALPSIVLHDVYDRVLERDATDAGAVYLTTPVEESSLSALVERLLIDTRAQVAASVARKWPRKQAGVAASVDGDEARVLDVSYGGLRLELTGASDERLSGIETVHIPSLGTVPVHPVWARGGAGASGRWWCGAEVNPIDEHATDMWRRFVDSLS